MKKLSLLLSPLFLGVLLVPHFAYAEETSTTTDATSTISTSTAPLTKAQLFTMCSQDAIELRDTKLAEARGSYNNAMTALLVERKNEEKAAVAIENEKEKKAAIKESVENYKVEVKKLQNTLTQSRKAIWLNFENDTKECREALDKVEIEDTPKEERKMTKEVVKKETTEAKEMKKEEKKEEHETTKTVKESIFDSIKSLFGKDN